MRLQLVEHLKQFTRSHLKDAEVFCFGSFASDLYLPNGDMDLVVVSDGYFNKVADPKYHTKKMLFKFSNLLKTYRICHEGETELVIGAKVPLVKYIDARTGLKVDISFENLTGVNAIETFKKWKRQYPVMPALVTLIKQFLLMRGLNEPVSGGLGGFSVICLVVSMLQLRAPEPNGAVNLMDRLGALLLEFLNLYGNQFNYVQTAISLNPPQYVSKVR